MSIVGIFQFLPMISAVFLMFGLPMYFVLPKAGFSRWWTLLVMVPFIGIPIVLYVLAFAKWPKGDVTEVFA